METLIICATHISSSRRKRLPAHTQKFRRKAAPRRRSLGQGECGLEYANKTNCEQSTSFANPQKKAIGTGCFGEGRIYLKEYPVDLGQGQWTCRFHRRRTRQPRSQMSVKDDDVGDKDGRNFRKEARGSLSVAVAEVLPRGKNDGWICDLCRLHKYVWAGS